MSESYNAGTVQNTQSSLVPVGECTNLDRQETLKVLKDIEFIITQFEEYNNEIETLTNKIQIEKAEAGSLVKSTTGARVRFWIIVLLSMAIGTIIMPGILTIIFGIVAGCIAWVKVLDADLKKHEKENNAAVANYTDRNVKPLQKSLGMVVSRRDNLINSGKLTWAIEIVGEELFCGPCISDLYNLVKSRRADNIKEALNKYDEIQHRVRMEKMQKSIQTAAEISATESKKQTEHAYQIEQIAKTNAAINYKKYKELKKINKKIR